MKPHVLSSVKMLCAGLWLALMAVFSRLDAQVASVFPELNIAPLQAANDPCGFDTQKSLHLLQVLGHGWGYGYDSLLVDLQRWRQSPYVRIDSVGASVQHRALWMLTITDPTPITTPRLRLWIHARTHPGEVQAWWVTNEIINLLLSETPLGKTLRRQCIFNIMPMYNPDGVELGLPRQNANHVDLESNWNTSPGEPEVQVLRGLFAQFMNTESPIRVALNMHSAYKCRRYFVYHDQTGTSPAYAEDEKVFIGDIRAYWPEGIENWDFFVSWTNGTPLVYPESWFWTHYREAVMALTYEDMNCEQAGEYDRTAASLLQGIADYLQIQIPTGLQQHITGTHLPDRFTLSQVFPNPAHAKQTVTLQFELRQAMPVTVALYDVLGRRMAVIADQIFPAGLRALHLSTRQLPSGAYWLQVQTPAKQIARKLILLR